MGRQDKVVEAKDTTIEGEVRYPGYDYTLECTTGGTQVVFLPSGTSESVAIPWVIMALKLKFPNTEWKVKMKQSTVWSAKDLPTKDIIAGVYWIDDNPGVTYDLG